MHLDRCALNQSHRDVEKPTYGGADGRSAIRRVQEQSVALRVPRRHAERMSEFRRQQKSDKESTVAATRDPILLLEPSDLLEPLNFEHRQVEGVTRSTLVDAAAVPPPRSTRAAGQALGATATSRRWGLKSALVGMGALACFGAGTAVSELTSLRLGDLMHSPAVDAAIRARAPVADAPVTSAAPKPAATKSSPPASPASSQEKTTGTRGGAAPMPSGPGQNKSAVDQSPVPAKVDQSPVPAKVDQSPVPAKVEQSPAPAKVERSPASARVDQSPAPAKTAVDAGAAACDQPGRPDDAKCLAGGIAAPATAPNRDAVADRKADGSAKPRSQPAPPPGASQQADAQRTDASASAHQEERGRQSTSHNRSRRWAQREGVEEQATADENAAASSGDRQTDRESNRESSRRRDRAARDSGRTASRWDRGQDDEDNDRTSDRGWSRRGNRYDADRGAGDRRGFGRAMREDDGVVVRGPRFGGPLGLFSFGRGW
jgi:hypothetical protein